MQGTFAPCSTPACHGNAKGGARGYCGSCYQVHRRAGRIVARTRATLAERVASKVEVVGECWLWRNSLLHGYGTISVCCNGVVERLYAHRVAWELMYGPVPEGMMVRHHCGNRACANSDHMFLTPKGQR